MSTESVSQNAMLVSHAPELRDPANAVKFFLKLMQARREYGFTEQELMAVDDHRQLLLWRHAMCYLRMWQED